MKIRKRSIITVGISPCWDVTVLAKNPQWGDHVTVEATHSRPAGKALNVSRALAWMQRPSTAMGLWAKADYEAMADALTDLKPFLSLALTQVQGQTRQNITLCDTLKNREMHLRAPCSLVSKPGLIALRRDLDRVVKADSICLLAGSMGQGRFDAEVLKLLQGCKKLQTRIALDTSGTTLAAAVKQGGLWLIKPNLDELSELLGQKIHNTIEDITQAVQPLLDQVEQVLVSRSKEGAMLISREGVSAGKCEKTKPIRSTVGCGDYLLAGFLQAIQQGEDDEAALRAALQAATAKCWGWTEDKSWPFTQRKIPIAMAP